MPVFVVSGLTAVGSLRVKFSMSKYYCQASDMPEFRLTISCNIWLCRLIGVENVEGLMRLEYRTKFPKGMSQTE